MSLVEANSPIAPTSIYQVHSRSEIQHPSLYFEHHYIVLLIKKLIEHKSNFELPTE